MTGTPALSVWGTGVCLELDKFSLHAVVFFSLQRKSQRPRKPTSQPRDLTEESETPVTVCELPLSPRCDPRWMDNPEPILASEIVDVFSFAVDVLFVKFTLRPVFAFDFVI